MLNILLQKVEDINSLEKTVMKMACEIMEVALRLLEEELFKNKPKHLRSIHFKKRQIYTKAGEITINRRYYENKKSGEKYYLLDKELGLRKRKKANGEYLKLLVGLANKLTFRQIEEFLEEANFPVLSHETINKELIDIGLRESEKIKQETAKVFDEGKEIQPEQKKEVDIYFWKQME